MASENGLISCAVLWKIFYTHTHSQISKNVDIYIYIYVDLMELHFRGEFFPRKEHELEITNYHRVPYSHGSNSSHLSHKMESKSIAPAHRLISYITSWTMSDDNWSNEEWWRERESSWEEKDMVLMMMGHSIVSCMYSLKVDGIFFLV